MSALVGNLFSELTLSLHFLKIAIGRNYLRGWVSLLICGLWIGKKIMLIQFAGKWYHLAILWWGGMGGSGLPFSDFSQKNYFDFKAMCFILIVRSLSPYFKWINKVTRVNSNWLSKLWQEHGIMFQAQSLIWKTSKRHSKNRNPILVHWIHSIKMKYLVAIFWTIFQHYRVD